MILLETAFRLYLSLSKTAVSSFLGYLSFIYELFFSIFVIVKADRLYVLFTFFIDGCFCQNSLFSRICQLPLSSYQEFGSGTNDFHNTLRHVNRKEFLISLSKKSSYTWCMILICSCPFFLHKEETLLLSSNPDNMVTIPSYHYVLNFLINLLHLIKNRI
jgi:hypothetical protein